MPQWDVFTESTIIIVSNFLWLLLETWTSQIMKKEERERELCKFDLTSEWASEGHQGKSDINICGHISTALRLFPFIISFTFIYHSFIIDFALIIIYKLKSC